MQKLQQFFHSLKTRELVGISPLAKQLSGERPATTIEEVHQSWYTEHPVLRDDDCAGID